MDFVQGLDPSKLVLTETVLAFALSPFTSPPYNLSLFLFGVYAQEKTESNLSLQTFTGLLGGSALFDIIWMIRHEQNGLVKFLTVVLLLLKIPTFLAFATALRQRGSQFGGLGIQGSDFSGPTVWSMPGGFTSEGRNGYQPLDGERQSQPVRPSAPPVPQVPSQQVSAQNTAPTPGAYQSV